MPLLPRPDLRSLFPLLVAGPLVALACPGTATAQQLAAGPGGPRPPIDIGGDITLTLELPDGDDYVEKSEPDELRFMNRANCACGAAVGSSFSVEFQLEDAASSLPNEEVQIWLGVTCDSEDADTQEQCQRLDDGFDDLEDLRGEVDRIIEVRDLISKDGTCPEQENSRWVYAIVDEDGGGFSGDDYSSSLEIKTDTKPPPEVTITSVSGGENAIRIGWDLPSSTDDYEYFQALCLREDGPPSPDDGFPTNGAQYEIAERKCNVQDGNCVRATSISRAIARGGVDGGLADAGADADAGVDADAGALDPDGGTGESECASSLPDRLATLDPTLVCGQASGSAQNLDIGGLTNGVAYHVVLLAVDYSRNVTALDVGVATPAPVRDFWEDYKGLGGSAKGGCSAGSAGFGGGLVLGLGLALWAGAARLRRRRGARRGRGGGIAAGSALLVALGAAPGVADAQPWWESYDDPVQAEVGPAQPDWNLELKVSPYVPDIDSEFGGSEPGPVERVFGDGPFILGQMTLDRFLLHPMGQLGVSLSLGFLTRSANAFEVDENGDTVPNENGKPTRSIGDTTTLRLFPASLGVVYRFTELDDRFRIPLVPYGRLGLSYYYWWITRPGGSTAEVPTDDCPTLDDCDGDAGRGGSLGWQATAGIALRAERVDPDAETALRNELGIEHAGLVFEYTYAVVDGFGSDEKLSVGDATFFGGINFEF